MILSSEGVGPFVPLTGTQAMPAIGPIIGFVGRVFTAVSHPLEEGHRIREMDTSSTHDKIQNLVQGCLFARILDGGDMNT